MEKCKDYLVNNQTWSVKKDYVFCKNVWNFNLTLGKNIFLINDSSVYEAGSIIVWSTDSKGGFIRTSKYMSSFGIGFRVWDMDKNTIDSKEYILDYTFSIVVRGILFVTEIIFKPEVIFQSPGQYSLIATYDGQDKEYYFDYYLDYSIIYISFNFEKIKF